MPLQTWNGIFAIFPSKIDENKKRNAQFCETYIFHQPECMEKLGNS